MIAYTGRVTGMVQGVGFRFFTRETGESYGLSGWVKNLYDGSVEYFVQGAPDAVKRFLERLRQGPPFGRVDKVTAAKCPQDKKLSGFGIRF
jgi:acylphosphatase